MFPRQISQERYQTITRLALWSLVVIVVSGAAVRLTGSGLGCSDWPNCSADRFVPEREFHGLVEFVNRLFTGVVSAAVMIAVLGSIRRVPRRPDLTILSWGLVAGVIVQIILGGITVLTELRPEIVMAHFLVSMILIMNAFVLHHRAGLADAVVNARPVKVPGSPDRFWTIAVVALTSVAVFAGTIVTAAGPHAGDEDVTRLGVDLPNAARVHAFSVWVLLGVGVSFLVLLARREPPDQGDTVGTDSSRRVLRALQHFLVAVVAQGTIGYVQYANDTPALLVGFHIAGACAVWTTALRLLLIEQDIRRAADGESIEFQRS